MAADQPERTQGNTGSLQAKPGSQQTIQSPNDQAFFRHRESFARLPHACRLARVARPSATWPSRIVAVSARLCFTFRPMQAIFT